MNNEEKETLKEWEDEIKKYEQDYNSLYNNKAWKAGIETAQIRVHKLIEQLLSHKNTKDEDLYLKAEINHIFNTFTRLNPKQMKTQLDEYVAQRLGTKING